MNIRDLVRLVHGHSADWHKKPIVVIYAYFDPSGSHDQSKILAFGGLIGFPDDWEKCTTAWMLVLQKYDLKEFHAVDCVNHTGEFADRSFAERLTILGAFIDALTEMNLMHIASVLLMDDWRALSPEDQDTLERSPWHFAFHCAIQQTIRWSRKMSVTERVGFLLDVESPAITGKALEVFRSYKESPTWRDNLAGLAFDSSVNVWQLQAADLFAFGAYRMVRDEHFGTKERFPFVKPFERLISRFAIAGGIYDKEALKNLLVNMRSGAAHR